MANYNYGGGGYPGPGYPGPQGGPGYNPPPSGAPGYNPPGGIRYNPPPGGPGYNPPPGGPGYNPTPGGQGYNPTPGAPGYNPSGGPGFNPGGQGVNPPPGQYGPQQGYGGQPGSLDQNIVQWFHAVDRDRTGKITANELQMALTNSNWSKFNMDTCKLMINMFDRDKSGQIDLNEFQALWAYIHQWKSIFDQFDGDRSGSIDANELHNAYLQMGYRLSPQFAQSVVSRFDMNGQHKISLDFFIHSCVLIKSITDQFRAKDAANTGMIQVGYEDFLSAVVLNRI